MNLQNLMSQLGNASNPIQMLMSTLNPNQKQVVNQFKGKSNQEQAQMIADYCNNNNISKDQLKDIITMINNKGLK